MTRKALWMMASILFVVSTTLSGTNAFSDNVPPYAGQLTSQIDYWYVGHLGQFDDEGRLLVWEGSIGGDFSGVARWWFEVPPPVAGSTTVGSQWFFYAARWEIWHGNELILAGQSVGKTVFPDGADGIWDGHGVVTEASGAFNVLKGRKVYETGPVLVGEYPPLSYTGTGMFSIF